jgi:hypothetical protein
MAEAGVKFLGYRILVSDTLAGLEEVIEVHRKLGWDVQGGLCSYLWVNKGEAENRYAQAMVCRDAAAGGLGKKEGGDGR